MPEEEVSSNSQQEIIQEKEEVERVEDATPHSEVYKFYEQNISSLSPYIAKELKEWMQRVSGDKVLEALKIAFENNKGTFAYVKGILRNWCNKKLENSSEEKSVMGSLEKRRSILSSVFNLHKFNIEYTFVFSWLYAILFLNDRGIIYGYFFFYK